MVKAAFLRCSSLPHVLAGIVLATTSLCVAAAGEAMITLADELCPKSGLRIGVIYDGRVEINGISISTASI